MWVNASSSDWNGNHCYRVVSPPWGTRLQHDCHCNRALFPSVFTCQYHSYCAPQTSSKCSSYQKDKRAKPGSLPKINALSGIGVQSSPASFPLLHRPNSPHATTLPLYSPPLYLVSRLMLSALATAAGQLPQQQISFMAIRVFCDATPCWFVFVHHCRVSQTRTPASS